MDLVLTDDQSMLSNTAREFFAGTKGLARLRKLLNEARDRGRTRP